MAVGAQLQLDSIWIGVLVKLILMLVFVPLFFAMRLLTLAEVRTFLSRGLVGKFAR
jgi:predicted ABC-type exoprotein transport system permease subunit